MKNYIEQNNHKHYLIVVLHVFWGCHGSWQLRQCIHNNKNIKRSSPCLDTTITYCIHNSINMTMLNWPKWTDEILIFLYNIIGLKYLARRSFKFMKNIWRIGNQTIGYKTKMFHLDVTYQVQSVQLPVKLVYPCLQLGVYSMQPSDKQLQHTCMLKQQQPSSCIFHKRDQQSWKSNGHLIAQPNLSNVKQNRKCRL